MLDAQKGRALCACWFAEVEISTTRSSSGDGSRLFLSRRIEMVIHGGASGADRLAASWAKAEGVPVTAYPAAWKIHGRAAGPIRNQRMLDEGKPDLVVAFPGGRGTADMIARARRAGVEVREVAPA